MVHLSKNALPLFLKYTDLGFEADLKLLWYNIEEGGMTQN